MYLLRKMCWLLVPLRFSAVYSNFYSCLQAVSCVFLLLMMLFTSRLMLHQMTFMSFNSKSTGVTGEALPVHLSSSTDFTGVRVAQSCIFCVMFCRSLLFFPLTLVHISGLGLISWPRADKRYDMKNAV